MAEITVQEIERLLSELGPDADTVAARLTTLGCKGVPISADECPVAIYLNNQLDLSAAAWMNAKDGIFFTVTSRGGDVWRDFPEDRMIEFVTPSPVGQFIRRFDGGGYPHLVKPLFETWPSDD